MKVNTVFLEDNNEYAIMKEIKANGYNYLYLANINDPEDFCIRKEKENDKSSIYPLEDENEFIYALKLYEG